MILVMLSNKSTISHFLMQIPKLCFAPFTEKVTSKMHRGHKSGKYNHMAQYYHSMKWACEMPMKGPLSYSEISAKEIQGPRWYGC